MLRKLAALLVSTFCATDLIAEDLLTIKRRVGEYRSSAANVQIKLGDGKKLSGAILRAEADTFTISQEKTAQEVTLRYDQVTEVRKKGGISKAILIPAVVGGGALLVLCAAPYPIGFLCRKDPS